MAKETFYFSHDFGARNDPKLQKVLMKLGHEGKSVYWDLIEMLYEQDGYLQLGECESYAFALRTTCDCITSVINDFELFKNDGIKFWSESAINRLSLRKEKSKKAKESCEIRWQKKKDTNVSNEDTNVSNEDTNVSSNQYECNTIEESKVNKNKLKENIPPIPPTDNFSFNSVQRNNPDDYLTVPCAEIREKYNEICKKLNPCSSLGNSRKMKIVDRWRENPSMEYWEDVFKKANDVKIKDWKPTFDWLFKDDVNYLKIVEGSLSGKNDNINSDYGDKYTYTPDTDPMWIRIAERDLYETEAFKHLK